MHKLLAPFSVDTGEFLPSILYVVATPIGNLSDISARAISAIASADIICAEDTRVTLQLMNAYGIHGKLISLRKQNESRMTDQVINWLKRGKVVIQVSDAGTPALSDPGAKLVDAVWKAGFQVKAIPGCSAVTAAWSITGITTPQFMFAGFLPSKTGERQLLLQQWLSVHYAVICYEAPHRIVDTLADIVGILGEMRSVCLIRELSKTFETVFRLTAGELFKIVNQDPNQQRGEIVIVIDSVNSSEMINKETLLDEESQRIVKILSADLPTKQASVLASQITGVSKKKLYDYVVSLKTQS